MGSVWVCVFRVLIACPVSPWYRYDWAVLAERKRKKGNKESVGEDTKSSRPCTAYWHNCEREDKISFGFSPISVDSVTLNEHQQFLNETLALALWDSAQKVTPHLYLCIIPQTMRGTRRTLSILYNSAFQLVCFLCYLMFMLCPSVQCVCLCLQVSLKPFLGNRELTGAECWCWSTGDLKETCQCQTYKKMK